jgi:hypothetical protein
MNLRKQFQCDDELRHIELRLNDIGRRRHQVFTSAIDKFRRSFKLQHWRAWWSPIQVSAFGTGSTRTARRVELEERRGDATIAHLDHYACLGAPRRLAVIMSWPYVSKRTVEEYAAAALPPPRFVVGVDDGDELRKDDARPPSGIYSAGTTGWIVADAQTLGSENLANKIVSAFLSGDYGLAEGTETQKQLDAEYHEWWQRKSRLQGDTL